MTRNLKWEEWQQYLENEPYNKTCSNLPLPAFSQLESDISIELLKDINVNEKDEIGETVLLWAVKEGREDIIKWLVNKGADINVTNKNGDTLLMLATNNYLASSVQLFIDKGVDINARNKYGDTALIKSIDYKKETVSEAELMNVVKLLIKNGADINIIPKSKSKFAYTALMEATNENYFKLVKFLLNNGANVNLKNEAGMTALMIAAEEGYVNILQLLLEKGADVNIKNESGETALNLAEERKNEKVIEILKRN
ncbi:ankyrin repeat domain-containing protein [Crocosphaera sp. Alani8]|uniref:ankyrin repeat domain-containing protein n=1 Tax=Crocosphaera sp. Alani8 TaxID=3038952 RepID=UPI00313B1E80